MKPEKLDNRTFGAFFEAVLRMSWHEYISIWSDWVLLTIKLHHTVSLHKEKTFLIRMRLFFAIILSGNEGYAHSGSIGTAKQGLGGMDAKGVHPGCIKILDHRYTPFQTYKFRRIIKTDYYTIEQAVKIRNVQI